MDELIRQAIIDAEMECMAGYDVDTYGSFVTRAEVAKRAGCSVKTVSKSAVWKNYRDGVLSLPKAPSDEILEREDELEVIDEPKPVGKSSIVGYVAIGLIVAALLVAGIVRGCGGSTDSDKSPAEQRSVTQGVLNGMADVLEADGNRANPRLATVAEFNRCYIEAFALSGAEKPGKIQCNPKPDKNDRLTPELRQRIAAALRQAAKQ